MANLLHHALLAVDDGQYQSAVPQLERVLKVEPSLALANQQMESAQWPGEIFEDSVAAKAVS